MKRRERGGGTVYQDGKWRVAAVSIGSGKNRRTRKKKAATEAAAWDRLRELREDQPALLTDDPAVTVETFLRAWLDDIVKPWGPRDDLCDVRERFANACLSSHR